MTTDVLVGLNVKFIQTIYEVTNNIVVQLDPILNNNNVLKISDQQKSNVIFGVGDPIAGQIRKFRQQVKENRWNGVMLFIGFKGAFKLEYWEYYEEVFRGLPQLTKISFIDTQLDYQHLKALKFLIQWVRPTELTLIFEQNEIDDNDIDEFLIDGVLETLADCISKFQIKSNPGIFKGNFLFRLKEKLTSLNKTNNIHEFFFIENKEMKSIAFLRIDKQNPQKFEQQIEKLRKSIDSTYYYKLNLKGCFVEQNMKIIQYMIEQSYDEDKLEQIQELDISDCIFEDASTFESLCNRLATSTGLLKLSLQNQAQLKDSGIIQTLMGDRYVKFRLNFFDWSNNPEIHVKGIKILADRLLSQSLKHFKFEGSLDATLSVLDKLFYITEAFEKKKTELSLTIENSNIKQFNKIQRQVVSALSPQIVGSLKFRKLQSG